jgi:hypothetical protein
VEDAKEALSEVEQSSESSVKSHSVKNARTSAGAAFYSTQQQAQLPNKGPSALHSEIDFTMDPQANKAKSVDEEDECEIL